MWLRQLNIGGCVKTRWLVVFVFGLVAGGLLGWIIIAGWSVWGNSLAEPEEEAVHESTPAENTYIVTEVILPAEAAERAGIRVESAEKYTLAPAFRAPARVSFNEEAMAQVGTPVPGLVVELKVKLGDVVRRDDVLLLVAPEKDALLVLADMATLWVIADVPEARLPQVAKGAKAHVRLAAAHDDVIEGTVSYIASNLDANTRSAQVRIEVSGQHRLLKPGMFAEVELFDGGTQYQEPVLAVPDVAVQTVEGRAVVFAPLPEKAGVFAKREVQVGGPGGRRGSWHGADPGRDQSRREDRDPGRLHPQG